MEKEMAKVIHSWGTPLVPIQFCTEVVWDFVRKFYVVLAVAAYLSPPPPLLSFSLELHVLRRFRPPLPVFTFFPILFFVEESSEQTIPVTCLSSLGPRGSSWSTVLGPRSFFTFSTYLSQYPQIHFRCHRLFFFATCSDLLDACC